MASETIKALLMLALFGALEVALYFPRLCNVQIWKQLRRGVALHRPVLLRPLGAPTAYALVPVRVRRDAGGR